MRVSNEDFRVRAALALENDERIDPQVRAREIAERHRAELRLRRNASGNSVGWR